MLLHPNLRHFKHGISLTLQWTGSEHKNMEKVFLDVLAGATDERIVKAAWGILDFIYYAHFETHTDKSLAQLDAAWLMFHKNKDVFEELEIHQHFNISKLHNIKHYFDCIRSRGTADGFNTENTEQLHINFAKMGYNASNKKEYINQMTIWLCRQESIHHFSQYLQWVVPGYIIERVDEEEKQEESPDKEETIINKAAQDKQDVGSFTIAKKAPIVGADVETITNDYGGVNFLYYVDKFLCSTVPSHRALLTETTTFSLYKHVVLQLPPIPEVLSQPIHDVIQAVKGSPEKLTTRGYREATAGRFSTVLAHIKSGKMQNGSVGPLDGLHVAQVHAIFKLPDEFGFPHPLAYVNWFTPFQNPQADTGMHTVSQSTNAHD